MIVLNYAPPSQRNNPASNSGRRGVVSRSAYFFGHRLLDALNERSLEKAHASLSRGREVKHLSRLQRSVGRLRAGEPAFVDKPALKRTAVFFHELLDSTLLKRAVARRLASRSRTIFEEVAPHVSGDTVLDVGSGDGKIGGLIAQQLGKRVTLCDIVDYNGTQLPLVVYDGKKLPFGDKSFDCLLLCVVLHHSNDPFAILDEAFRVSRRVIVIESVFFNEPHRLFNSFFDWVYNRVLNNPNINVPFNFLRPAGWVHEFEKRGGRVVHMEHLGIDVPIAPKWHALYVVDAP